MDNQQTRRDYSDPFDSVSPEERDCERFGHEWPTELTADAQCEVCGLPYAEFTEK
jgi:hypothetical protein